MSAAVSVGSLSEMHSLRRGGFNASGYLGHG